MSPSLSFRVASCLFHQDGNDGDTQQCSVLDEESGIESITITVPGIGNKKVSLNTCQIEEKIMVANAIRDLADALGSQLGQYAPDLIQRFSPFIRFQYSAQVRIAAARALSSIFSSVCAFYCSTDPDASKVLIAALVNELTLDTVRQLVTENVEDINTMSALAESLSEICYCAYSCFKEGFTDVILQEGSAREVVGSLLRSVQKCLEYRKMTSGMVSNEEDEILSGESLLTSSVDAIGYILKSLGSRFLPIFEGMIHPFFSPFLKTLVLTDIPTRHAAICLYDDCVEHCGPVGASTYSSLLLDAVLHGIDDNLNGRNMAVKQASVYGLIQIARYNPHSLASCNATALISTLVDLSSVGKNARKVDIENLSLVENSASAIAALCLTPDSPFASLVSFDKSSCLDVFLHNLPIQEDEDEAKVTLSFIFNYIFCQEPTLSFVRSATRF